MDEEELPVVPSTQTVFLDKPPCCLAFCPFAPNYFVIGTYNLQKPPPDCDDDDNTDDTQGTSSDKKQQRDGSLSLFMIKGNHMYLLRTVETRSAILDIKFAPNKELPRDSYLFAVATSTGSICLYGCYLNEEQGGPGLWMLDECIVADEDVVITSLQFDPLSNQRICITQSDGKVKMINTPINLWFPRATTKTSDPFAWPLKPRSPEAITELMSHGLEAWISTFVPPSWSSKGVFSGGDDAVLQLVSTLDEQGSVEKRWADRKIHQAGVTAVLPLKPGVVATGSYDDHLRVLAIPQEPGPGRVQVLHEINLGGGVWRLVPYEHRVTATEERWTLLVCAMYAGAFLVELTHTLQGDSWDSKTVAKFITHESMCYGGDVLSSGDLESEAADGKRTFVTCSFYDKRLCLWRF